MARMSNVRVWSIDPGSVAEEIYRPLLSAKGVSGRAQQRISRQLRMGIQIALQDMVTDIEAQGFGGSGQAVAAMRKGIRVFGTSFGSLRGHILGPGYILAHERGTKITPKNGDWLAIPLPAALRPDGTPKLPRPIMWKNVVDSFTWKSKKTGRVYIVYRKGRGLVLLYALVEEVQLTKWKGFLSRAWARQEPELAQYYMRAMLHEFDQVDLLNMARVKTTPKTYRPPPEPTTPIRSSGGFFGRIRSGIRTAGSRVYNFFNRFIRR